MSVLLLALTFFILLLFENVNFVMSNPGSVMKAVNHVIDVYLVQQKLKFDVIVYGSPTAETNDVGLTFHLIF